jgi:hypothetical protein
VKVMSNFQLNRRTFLRGLAGGTAVSFALPPLEAMFNTHGDLLAQGRPIPKRFGVWFWGNGVRRAHWLPDGTGANWTARAELEPLVRDPALRPYVSPVTGLEIKTATHPHHSGMTGIMTGARYHQNGTTRDTIVSTFAYPSIDQVVAERWANDPATRAPFRSLEVGICRFRGTDEGTTFQHLSHNGPNNVNPSEYEPIRLFNRLFGMPLSQQRDAARQSVLDAVKQDLDALKVRVSSADRIRLDQHTDSVRSIELRLGTAAAACTTPPRPQDSYPDDMGREPIAERNQVLSDILAMAMACDLTRVFSVLFSTCGAGTVFWMSGARNGLHQIAHDERDPGPEPQPTLHAATTFTMEQLAYFLNRLRSIQEGAQNLLDSCAILCTTELSEGYTHTNDEFPIVLAGRAGGRLRGGYHYRSTARDNTSRALLTLLRAIDDPRPSFGYAAGEVSQPIAELLL